MSSAPASQLSGRRRGARRSEARDADTCPFIDLGDPRCESRFTLQHLSDAFRLCVGGYRSCPNFYRLSQEHPHYLIKITQDGRALQPTGT